MWIYLGPMAWTAERAARTARLEKDLRIRSARRRGHSVSVRDGFRGHGDPVLAAAVLRKVRPLASIEGNAADPVSLDQKEKDQPARFLPDRRAERWMERKKRERTSCSCGTLMA